MKIYMNYVSIYYVNTDHNLSYRNVKIKFTSIFFYFYLLFSIGYFNQRLTAGCKINHADEENWSRPFFFHFILFFIFKIVKTCIQYNLII
jgi:hypothetical protein